MKNSFFQKKSLIKICFQIYDFAIKKMKKLNEQKYIMIKKEFKNINKNY